MKLDSTEKVLLGFTFLVLLASFCFGEFVRPMTTKESCVMILLAFEPVFVFMLRRTFDNRKKNSSTALFYGKVAVCLFGAVWLLASSLHTILG